MSHLIAKVSFRRTEREFLDRPALPLAGAALGMIAIVNVASVIATLLAA
jgi:hypothetical protein